MGARLRAGDATRRATSATSARCSDEPATPDRGGGDRDAVEARLQVWQPCSLMMPSRTPSSGPPRRVQPGHHHRLSSCLGRLGRHHQRARVGRGRPRAVVGRRHGHAPPGPGARHVRNAATRRPRGHRPRADRRLGRLLNGHDNLHIRDSADQRRFRGRVEAAAGEFERRLRAVTRPKAGLGAPRDVLELHAHVVDVVPVSIVTELVGAQ